MTPRWHVSHAKGYLELGMLAEAASELALLPEDWQGRIEVLGLRAALLQEQREWLLLQPVAAELVKRSPEEAGWWITWAYATRRADSLAAANDILRDAEARHPREATIQFNLACYACQLGDLAEARRRLKSAVELDAHFAESALSDPDLEPLRREGLDLAS